jgi:hypothetical protein
VKLLPGKKNAVAVAPLFPKPTPVPLRTRDSVPTDTALFPMHVYAGQLPNLVCMRVDESGKPTVLATGWWGGPGVNPEATAVRVNPATFKRLAPKAKGDVTATAQKAGVWQVLRSRRGFVFNLATVLAVAVTAVALAVIGVVLDERPFLWVAVVGLIASIGECARAATDIRGAFGAEGG